MKRIVVALFILIGFISFAPASVKATSEQAYQDYLYQFDVYRQKYSDFKVARNEYLKFNTLTSQNTALIKTRDMIVQRNILLRTYLLLLKEKLNESTGVSDVDKNYYTTLIQNEISWLDVNSKLIPSIGSLEDANSVSRLLIDHYDVLQGSMLQIISGISIGNLTRLAKQYDINLADANALVNINRGLFTPEKQSLFDRWLLQITNTRSLYQQKVDTVSSKVSQLKGNQGGSIDTNSLLSDNRRVLGEARQYLIEGTSYLSELTREIKYKN